MRLLLPDAGQQSRRGSGRPRRRQRALRPRALFFLLFRARSTRRRRRSTRGRRALARRVRQHSAGVGRTRRGQRRLRRSSRARGGLVGARFGWSATTLHNQHRGAGVVISSAPGLTSHIASRRGTDNISIIFFSHVQFFFFLFFVFFSDVDVFLSLRAQFRTVRLLRVRSRIACRSTRVSQRSRRRVTGLGRSTERRIYKLVLNGRKRRKSVGKGLHSSGK